MIEDYKKTVESALNEYFEQYSNSNTIWKAMSYTTLLEGAKRLRAIMCIEIGKFLGAKIEELIPCACALEIMHSYSLIHDDLPCMDNDDLRRSKPTNHKVFGEAIALLAGDALISLGAQLIIEKTPKSVPISTILDIVLDYSICAGAKGIVAGQVADIEAEGREIDIKSLEYIHRYKTGALFKLSILSGAKIAQAKPDIIEKLAVFADDFGVLFQIYDDIIDCTLTTKELGKTANKDEASKKLTYVSAYGLEKAKNIFYSLIDKNRAILKQINIESKVFDDIYNKLIKKIGV